MPIDVPTLAHPRIDSLTNQLCETNFVPPEYPPPSLSPPPPCLETTLPASATINLVAGYRGYDSSRMNLSNVYYTNLFPPK